MCFMASIDRDSARVAWQQGQAGPPADILDSSILAARLGQDFATPLAFETAGNLDSFGSANLTESYARLVWTLLWHAYEWN